jgi:hypothetical protein
VRRHEPGWLLAFKIILVCVAAVFTLGVAALSLTFQPYVLVMAHNLTGAPVDIDLGIDGSAIGSRHVGRDGWSLGVLKVGPDTEAYLICRAETGPSVRTETGLYITSSIQQLLVADVERCDKMDIDSHAVIEPLNWIFSRHRD